MVIKANEEYFKKCLKRRNLDLRQLAHLTGINYGTIRNVASGNQNTSYETAQAIATILYGSVYKLFYIQFDSNKEKDFYKMCTKVIKEN